jgi:hypothetical protein
MRKTFYYIVLLIITLSCSEKKTPSENSNLKNSKSDRVLKTEEINQLEDNSDCVFEDDYKKVTEDWLNDLEIKKYVWDPKTNKAIVIYNGDTLTLYRGGCNHFISSVEFKTAIYPNKTLDTTILRKIKEVACKFKFDNYCKKLSEGLYKKTENSNSSFFLEFEDDNTEDNLFFNGIQIIEKEKRTSINISEYYD